MARPNAIARKKGWSPGLTRFQRKLNGLTEELLPTVLDLTYESIVNGSAITGAPGQPEAEGDLIDSWDISQQSPTVGRVYTMSEYARPNEDGVRKNGKPYVQVSSRGGRHSVRLTKRGMQKLVDHAAKNVMEKAGQGVA